MTLQATAPAIEMEGGDEELLSRDDNVTQIVAKLFAEGNQLLTSPSGPLVVKEDTRSLLALFSDGRFLVCDSHKFDGRVLSFEVLARKRRFQVGPPEYVSMTVIRTIYEAAQNRALLDIRSKGDDLNQSYMQREFVNLISRAAEAKVSDVHIVVGDHTSIQFRVNGVMQDEKEHDKTWGEAFVRAAFASADVSDKNYAENEYQAAQKQGGTPLRGSDGRLQLPSDVLGVRLQFNPIAFGTQYLVMRLLYGGGSDHSGDLASLGFTKYEQELFFRMRASPMGLAVISGPTGHGKSTTLQRNMIRLLREKRYEINLLTVEDPPEYPIPGARQMPVTNANTEQEKEREFGKALNAALRSDPDYLMVGEVRSLSAAQLVFKGALSGHGVWTTLHANSSLAILTRFRDMGVESFKLKDPDLMTGMVAQRLMRRLCPSCRVPLRQFPQDPVFKRVRAMLGDEGVERSYMRGPGCSRCNNKGFVGRTAVAEILLPDAKILDYTWNGETQRAHQHWIENLRGRTLRDAAIEKMMLGEVDVPEVERWCGLLVPTTKQGR